MEWAPAFSFDVEKVALPADEVTVPSEVVVSLKVMLPEIVPATLELTDAVKVTVWPKAEGLTKTRESWSLPRCSQAALWLLNLRGKACCRCMWC